MFMYQMIEDVSFDDIEVHFNEDSYFSGFSGKYSLGEEEKTYFNEMKKQEEGYRTSLRVLTVVQDGMLPRVVLKDEDDGLRGVDGWDYDELGRMPVDMYYSKDMRKAIRLVTLLLLERTYFKRLAEKGK